MMPMDYGWQRTILTRPNPPNRNLSASIKGKRELKLPIERASANLSSKHFGEATEVSDPTSSERRAASAPLYAALDATSSWDHRI